LILRGTCGQHTCGELTCGQQIKPIEFRSRATKIIGERFYIYASRQWASGKLFLEGCRLEVQSDECRVQNEDRRVISDNLEVPEAGPQPWMLELAKMLILKDLPTGVIVGTAVIAKVASCQLPVASEEAGNLSSLATGNWQLTCTNGI
jgi:hypothetical protein